MLLKQPTEQYLAVIIKPISPVKTFLALDYVPNIGEKVSIAVRTRNLK